MHGGRDERDCIDPGVPGPAPIVTRERAAVALLFFLNGMVMGAWAPKIPFFSQALGLTESMLGVMLFVFGVGSLVMMPIAGLQIARFGFNRVVQISTLLYIQPSCC